MTPATSHALQLEAAIAAEPRRIQSYHLIVNGHEQTAAIQTLAEAEHAAALFLGNGDEVAIRGSDGSYKTFSIVNLPA